MSDMDLVDGFLAWGPGLKNRAAVRFIQADLARLVPEADSVGFTVKGKSSPKKDPEGIFGGCIYWGPGNRNSAPARFAQVDIDHATRDRSGEPPLLRVKKRRDGDCIWAGMLPTPIKVKGQPCYRETVDGVEMVIHWDAIRYKNKKTGQLGEWKDRYRIPNSTTAASKQTTVMHDFERALSTMRKIGAARGKELKLNNLADGSEAKTLFGTFKRAMELVVACGILDILVFITDTCDAFKLLKETFNLIIEAKIVTGSKKTRADLGKERLSLTGAVELLGNLMDRLVPKKPTLVSVLVSDYVALQEQLWRNAAISDATKKRRATHGMPSFPGKPPPTGQKSLPQIFGRTRQKDLRRLNTQRRTK